MMARKRAKAVPRPKRWYESTLLQVLGIVVPVLIILTLVVSLAMRRERTRGVTELADRPQVSVADRFFADRPEGQIGITPRSADRELPEIERPPAPSLEDLELRDARIASIEQSEAFEAMTLDEFYSAQANPSLSAAQREDLGNRLAGRRVLWNGTVEKISPQDDGTVNITIHNERDAFQRAFLAFPRDQQEPLRLLRVEHGVEVTGVVSSVVGWPFVESCEVLRSWPPGGEKLPDAAKLLAPRAEAPLETLLRNAKAGRD